MTHGDLIRWMDNEFADYKSKFDFWKQRMEGGCTVYTVIHIGQYYGQMCSIANLERELFVRYKLAKELDKIKVEFASIMEKVMEELESECGSYNEDDEDEYPIYES